MNTEEMCSNCKGHGFKRIVLVGKPSIMKIEDCENCEGTGKIKLIDNRKNK